MSSKALTIFDNPSPEVPAHIRDAFGDESNVTGRTTVPSLTFEGKVWTLNFNGEKTKLLRRNADGDEEPISTMKVVILNYNKDRGRTYYEGSYDPGKPGSPRCWSENGKVPHDSVSEPIAKSCKNCPMAAKGSKVTDQGKPAVACAEHRMIALVPEKKLDMEPLRLKISVTSDWDKRSPELAAQGWYGFSNFTDFIKTRNIKHTAQIVTKIKFDPNVAYPKLLFSPDRWLEPREVAVVAPVALGEEVKELLTGSWSPNGADGTPTADNDNEPMLEPVPKAEPPKAEAPKPKPAPVVQVPQVQKEAAALMVDDDDEDAAPPPPKKAPKVKETKKSEPVEVEAMDEVKAPSAKAPAGGEIDNDLAKLLDEWGE